MWSFLGAKHPECVPHVECATCANLFFEFRYFFYACNFMMYFASNVNVPAYQEHVEGKYSADCVTQNAEQVMSLVVTAMMPQRLNLQIVRIQVSRRYQVPLFFIAELQSTSANTLGVFSSSDLPLQVEKLCLS